MRTEDLVLAIIKEQSQIIGNNLAIHMAKSSGVVKFSTEKPAEPGEVTITNDDPKVVIGRLVNSYRELFGEASVEVCRNVLKKHSSNIVI